MNHVMYISSEPCEISKFFQKFSGNFLKCNFDNPVLGKSGLSSCDGVLRNFESNSLEIFGESS